MIEPALESDVQKKAPEDKAVSKTISMLPAEWDALDEAAQAWGFTASKFAAKAITHYIEAVEKDPSLLRAKPLQTPSTPIKRPPQKELEK